MPVKIILLYRYLMVQSNLPGDNYKINQKCIKEMPYTAMKLLLFIRSHIELDTDSLVDSSWSVFINICQIKATNYYLLPTDLIPPASGLFRTNTMMNRMLWHKSSVALTISP